MKIDGNICHIVSTQLNNIHNTGQAYVAFRKFNAEKIHIISLNVLANSFSWLYPADMKQSNISFGVVLLVMKHFQLLVGKF